MTAGCTAEHAAARALFDGLISNQNAAFPIIMPEAERNPAFPSVALAA